METIYVKRHFSSCRGTLELHFFELQAENTLKCYSSITGQKRHVPPFCLRLFLNCAEISRAKSDCAELFGGRAGDCAQRCFRRMRAQWLISVDRAPPRAHWTPLPNTSRVLLFGYLWYDQYFTLHHKGWLCFAKGFIEKISKIII